MYIRIPEDIIMRSPDGKQAADEPLTFKDWMKLNVLLDHKWGANAKLILMAADIKEKLEDATDVLVLDDHAYEELKKIVNEPTGGYKPVQAIQLVSFIRAIKSADDSPPVEAVDDDENTEEAAE